MNESDAKAAYRAMSIPAPSRCLIDFWLRAAELQRQMAEAEQPRSPAAEDPVTVSITPTTQTEPPQATAAPAASHGKSALEPILQKHDDLAEPSKRLPRTITGRPQ
jgi:hypothetical protein